MRLFVGRALYECRECRAVMLIPKIHRNPLSGGTNGKTPA